jgi:hypothetical protein
MHWGSLCGQRGGAHGDWREGGYRRQRAGMWIPWMGARSQRRPLDVQHHGDALAMRACCVDCVDCVDGAGGRPLGRWRRQMPVAIA